LDPKSLPKIYADAQNTLKKMRTEFELFDPQIIRKTDFFAPVQRGYYAEPSMRITKSTKSDGKPDARRRAC